MRDRFRDAETAESARQCLGQLRGILSEFTTCARDVAVIVVREMFVERRLSAIPRAADFPLLTYTLGGFVAFLAHDTTGQFGGAEAVAKQEVTPLCRGVCRTLPALLFPRCYALACTPRLVLRRVAPR